MAVMIKTNIKISIQCCISYRSQSIVFQSKTNDRFLYEMQYWVTHFVPLFIFIQMLPSPLKHWKA